MEHLFKAVTIIDKYSSFNGQMVDIHLKDGYINQVASSIEIENIEVITERGLCCSIGWFDLIAYTGEPGYEHRETIDTFTKAAAYGGFTEVACLPDVDPVVQNRSSIEYFKQRSQESIVQLHSIAAVTHNLEGKDLAELLDLKAAGAIAFSDSTISIQAADTVLKALEYLKLFGGVLINQSENKKISFGGQMHEGVTSTRLGLKGIPAIAEELQVTRDLQLLKYTGGKLHLTQLSTAAALKVIREAKQEGLNVTCDIAAHQCAFIDETILPFDTNYKVNPPFRSEEDRLAILDALQDGTIDAIVSAHTPWHEEAKELEFDLAEPGIIALQTAYSVATKALKSHINLTDIVEKLSVAPRKIVGLPIPALVEGEKANLTFFHPTRTWVYDKNINASAAQNSPFIGSQLEGCVYGTYMNGHFTPNPGYTH